MSEIALSSMPFTRPEVRLDVSNQPPTNEPAPAESTAAGYSSDGLAGPTADARDAAQASLAAYGANDFHDVPAAEAPPVPVWQQVNPGWKSPSKFDVYYAEHREATPPRPYPPGYLDSVMDWARASHR